MELLRIKSACKNFGGLAALSDVDLDVEEGSITSLIGPNGSGKSTLFNAISNLIPLDSGEIYFYGKKINHLPAYLIAGHGIARSFQIVSLFPEASVLENVLIGGFSKTKAEILSIIFRMPWTRFEEKHLKEKSIDALRFFGIEHLKDRSVSTLPFGQQRLVEMARAIVSEPKLLMLDEPLSGLNTLESEQLQEKILEIQSRGITILFVEHEMKAVMRLAEKIAVLNFGRKIAEGIPEEIRDNQIVIETYLGKEA